MASVSQEPAVLDSVRSDRKRKMSNESPKYVTLVYRYFVSNVYPQATEETQGQQGKEGIIGDPASAYYWLMDMLSHF